MNDKESLKLLNEMLQNIKKATEKYPTSFYKVFSIFASNLQNVSGHIKNRNLRLFFFHFYTLIDPLRESFTYAFGNRILNALKELFEEKKIDEGQKEIIANAVQCVTVRVIGDDEGRDIIDTKQMMSGLKDGLEGLDESTMALVSSTISSAIRKIFNEYIQESSKEMIAFYNELIESSGKNWTLVHNAILNYIIEKDNNAIIWKRAET